MSINSQLIQLRTYFFQFVDFCFISVAKIFGFPKNPGMPIGKPVTHYWQNEKWWDTSDFHKVQFPPHPIGEPRNYWEVIFGPLPRPETIPKIYYESKVDGFYGFYIERYKNVFFLPDWFSKLLQVDLGFCLDMSYLEVCQEMIFIVLIFYYNAINLRLYLGWIPAINPYVFPFRYYIAFVDWVDEYAEGWIPLVSSLGLGAPLLSFCVGRLADSLNHLVFTMPYLPSEKIYSKAMVDGGLSDVILFRHLPYLWYKYPIPNELREYWSTNRKDILKYMQTAYGQLPINFLPDDIDSINQVTWLQEQLSHINQLSNSLITNLLEKFAIL